MADVLTSIRTPGHRRHRIGRFAIGALALSGLAACSENPEVIGADTTVIPAAPTSTVATTTTEIATTTAIAQEDLLGETARRYFMELVEESREPNSAAEANSPAETYAFYFQTFGEALASSSIIRDTTSMSVDDAVVLLRSGDQTTSFGDIVVSDQGVRTFTVDGNPLEERLTTALPVVAGPLTVERAVSYLTANGAHVTAMVAVNTSDETISLNNWSAEFVDSSNRQVGTEDALGPIDLRPGARAAFGWVWSGTDPVGTMYFDGFTADFTEEFDLSLDFTYGG